MFEHSGKQLKMIINVFYILLTIVNVILFAYGLFSSFGKQNLGSILVILIVEAILLFSVYVFRLWMCAYAENAEANVMSQETLKSIYQVLTRIEDKLNKKPSINPEVHDVKKNIKDALKF